MYINEMKMELPIEGRILRDEVKNEDVKYKIGVCVQQKK